MILDFLKEGNWNGNIYGNNTEGHYIYLSNKRRDLNSDELKCAIFASYYVKGGYSNNMYFSDNEVSRINYIATYFTKRLNMSYLCDETGIISGSDAKDYVKRVISSIEECSDTSIDLIHEAVSNVPMELRHDANYPWFRSGPAIKIFINKYSDIELDDERMDIFKNLLVNNIYARISTMNAAAYESTRRNFLNNYINEHTRIYGTPSLITDYEGWNWNGKVYKTVDGHKFGIYLTKSGFESEYVVLSKTDEQEFGIDIALKLIEKNDFRYPGDD